MSGASTSLSKILKSYSQRQLILSLSMYSCATNHKMTSSVRAILKTGWRPAPLKSRQENLDLVWLPDSQEPISIDYLPAKHCGLCWDSLEIYYPPYHFTSQESLVLGA